MPEDSAAQRWAREVPADSTLSWGAIEQEVLAHEPLRSDTPAWAYVLGAVGWAGSAVLLVPVAGAPLIGLVLLLVALGRTSTDAPDGLLTATALVFGFTCILLIAGIRAWWSEGRRRNMLFVSFGVVALVCGGVGLVVSVAGGGELDLGLVRATTAVSSFLALALVLVAALAQPRPAGKRPPRRGPRGDGSRRRYTHTRERVLDILLERQLVHLDPADRQRMIEMPLGYWEELDGVEERERSRILELRTVGWRQFDDRDARPWPTPRP